MDTSIKDQIQNMRLAILDAIAAFEEETGLLVTDIEINRAPFPHDKKIAHIQIKATS
jgi:hypothetical protein